MMCDQNRAQLAYRKLISEIENFPVRFMLDDETFSGFPRERFTLLETKEQNGGHVLALSYSDNLCVRIETRCDADFGAYEWTIWFENPGEKNSPVISHLNAHVTFEGENPCVRGILGDHVNYYRPYCADLDKEPLYFCNRIGRSCHETFPFFNLEHGEGGTLIALGWGGTWEAKFEKEEDHTLFHGNGTLRLNTYLKPGEKIRTGLFAFVCYEGRDEDIATNVWRRWIVKRNFPKANAQGDPIRPILTKNNSSIDYLKRLEKDGVHMDFNWIDAGWFAAADGKPVAVYAEMSMLENVGSWAIDNSRCACGLTFREFIDASHELGTKTLVWFEPERVTHVEDLEKYFGYNPSWALPVSWKGSKLNNLGNEECYQWTFERIRRVLDEMNVDMYREDFNTEPGPAWEWGDRQEGVNRRGITENKYMVNHYRLWDEIIALMAKKNKCTYIDSCASGGGRNDLETIRRSIPLLRSDFDRRITSLRLSISSSLHKWLPFTGAVSMECEQENDSKNSQTSVYIARASYAAKLHLVHDIVLENSSLPLSFLKTMADEWRSICDYFLKDFYPLTLWRSPYETEHWTVMEYFDPDTDSGILQAFRMEECLEENCCVSVRGLDENRLYDVLDFDGGENGRTGVLGSELKNGFTLHLPEKKSSALLKIVPHAK